MRKESKKSLSKDVMFSRKERASASRCVSSRLSSSKDVMFSRKERASRPRSQGGDKNPLAWHSRGYLPHWEAGEVPQSLTFRLHDTLPREVRERLDHDVAQLPEQEQETERRKSIEALLDAGRGACWLGRPEVAGLVEDTLLHFDGILYRLHAWCVMPNHVHVLITPLQGNSLSSIMHSMKSYTAKKANDLLGRKGAFWQQEYFDRAIRNETHYARTIWYIENNPVAAGLCKTASDWKWSSSGMQ